VIYDICNTTSCQAFEATAVQQTSDAAAATSGVVLSQDGSAIFKSEYALEPNDVAGYWDGTKSDGGKSCTDGQICYNACPDGQTGESYNNWPCMKDFISAGAPYPKYADGTIMGEHGRGMSQWGSQRWASGKNAQDVSVTAPRDWRCILDHYYNANGNSVVVDPTYTPGRSGPGHAGTQTRTALMANNPNAYGSIAWEAVANESPTGIRGETFDNLAQNRAETVLVSSGGYPSWEPGGARLAYWSTYDIGVVNADGSGAHLITNAGPGFQNYAPAWSPLGDVIAFCRVNLAARTTEIWTVRPDGTNPQPIITGLNILNNLDDYEIEACYMRWSPDGTRIAFTGATSSVPWPNCCTEYDVYTINMTPGATPSQWTSCHANGGLDPSACTVPSWSPYDWIDSGGYEHQQIAFSDADAIYGDNIGPAGVYLFDVNFLPITYTPVLQTNSYVNLFPQWSSDGQKIFFTAQDPTYSWSVWSINPDGSGKSAAPLLPPHNAKYHPYGIDVSRCQRFDQ
jgi:hypothetical protein